MKVPEKFSRILNRSEAALYDKEKMITAQYVCTARCGGCAAFQLVVASLQLLQHNISLCNALFHIIIELF